MDFNVKRFSAYFEDNVVVPFKTKPYYECHVTFMADKDFKEQVEALGWRYSRIDGDPMLGAGVKTYATKHFNAKLHLDVVVEAVNTAATMLAMKGARVQRVKVEVVVYDIRAKEDK